MEKLNLRFDCGQSYDQMTKTEAGALCEKCSTEVVDFTDMSLEEIKKAFKLGDIKCGKFRNNQINTIDSCKERVRLKRKAGAIALVVCLSLSSVAYAQSSYGQKKMIGEITLRGSEEELKQEVKSKNYRAERRRRRFSLVYARTEEYSYYASYKYPFFWRRKKFFSIGCPSF